MHAHTHHHHAAKDASTERALRQAFLLIATFMVVEAVAGWLTNSLTLIADAGHMFLDAAALGLAWYAVVISRREQDQRLSYGYHRFQVLAAFINALTLIGLVLWIVVEAVMRIRTPEPMLPIPTLLVAATGFVVNIIAFRLLHAGDKTANVRAAALHVLGDLLGSAAAIIAALVIYTTGWFYADPLLALVIATILARGAWRVLKESTHILLEGVPNGLCLTDIKQTLAREVPGVLQIHHVHAWALTAEKPLLTLHAQIDANADICQTIQRIKHLLRKQFAIEHSTIQLEPGHCPDEVTEPAH